MHLMKSFHFYLFMGFLHLLGYDHEVDNGEHRKEEELIKNLIYLIVFDC